MPLPRRYTKVMLRWAPWEGVKVCKEDGCAYTVSKQQKENKCQYHGDTQKLCRVSHYNLSCCWDDVSEFAWHEVLCWWVLVSPLWRVSIGQKSQVWVLKARFIENIFRNLDCRFRFSISSTVIGGWFNTGESIFTCVTCVFVADKLRAVVRHAFVGNAVMCKISLHGSYDCDGWCIS